MSVIKFIRCIAVLGLLFWNLVSLAADSAQLYQFELIIFSHITNETLQSEYWPSVTDIVIPSNAIELDNDQIVPRSQWQLDSEQKFLLKNKYPILLHLAWQAPASSLTQAQVIHLSGGEAYDNGGKQVNGIVSMSLARYFNVHFNLEFLLPWADIQDLNLANVTHDDHNPYLTFKINEDLRMRSNELNYIDHPLYGILFKITQL